MGFRLELEGGRKMEQMLRLLRTSPSNIFPQPFSGYLLFLFTGREQSLIKAFRREVIDLDALTGDTVAFALFVERLTLTVSSADPPPGRLHQTRKRPASAREFNSSDLSRYPSVIQLVKSGKLGWINKGDELIACTYATNKIARELGILSKLPCLVVYDGHPGSPYETVPLTKELLSELIPILRSTIDRLRSRPGYRHYLDVLNELHQLNANTSRMAHEVDECMQRSKFVNYITSQLRQKDVTDRIRDAIVSDRPTREVFGLVRSALVSNSTDRADFADEAIFNFTISIIRKLRRKRATCLRCLEFENDWPLNDNDTVSFANFYKRYVRVNSINTPKTVPAAREEITAVREQISKEANEIESNFIIDLGQLLENKLDRSDIDAKSTAMQNSLAERERQVAVESEHFASKLLELDVSFSNIFLEQVNRKYRNAVALASKDRFLHFLRPWLRPQTLVHLAEHFARVGFQ